MDPQTKLERTIPLEIMPEKKDKDGVPVYDFTFEDVVRPGWTLDVTPSRLQQPEWQKTQMRKARMGFRLSSLACVPHSIVRTPVES